MGGHIAPRGLRWEGKHHVRAGGVKDGLLMEPHRHIRVLVVPAPPLEVGGQAGGNPGDVCGWCAVKQNCSSRICRSENGKNLSEAEVSSGAPNVEMWRTIGCPPVTFRQFHYILWRRPQQCVAHSGDPTRCQPVGAKNNISRACHR